jgi:hypothetical protein
MVHRQNHLMRAPSARTRELTPRVAIGRALTGREALRRSAREVACVSGDVGRLIELLDLLVALADEARSGCSADSLLRLHRIRLLARHVQWVLTNDGIVSLATGADPPPAELRKAGALTREQP